MFCPWLRAQIRHLVEEIPRWATRTSVARAWKQPEENRTTVESLATFLFSTWKSACPFDCSLYREYYRARDEYPFTCAINLSPREADLIRIGKPDTYLNARLH